MPIPPGKNPSQSNNDGSARKNIRTPPPAQPSPTVPPRQPSASGKPETSKPTRAQNFSRHQSGIRQSATPPPTNTSSGTGRPAAPSSPRTGQTHTSSQRATPPSPSRGAASSTPPSRGVTSGTPPSQPAAKPHSSTPQSYRVPPTTSSQSAQSTRQQPSTAPHQRPTAKPYVTPTSPQSFSLTKTPVNTPSQSISPAHASSSSYAKPTAPTAPTASTAKMKISYLQCLIGVTITSLLFSLIAFGTFFVISAREASLALHKSAAGGTMQGLNASNRPIDSSNIPLGVQAIAKRVLPSVVSIECGNDFESGIIFDDRGYIVTTDDLIQNGDPSQINVVFSDYSYAEATLIGEDRDTDIAVLKVNKENLVPITIGSSAHLQVGQQILTVSSPRELPDSITSGIVSAINRSYMVLERRPPHPCFEQEVHLSSGQVGYLQYACYDVIQTDAGINPGSFGGAMVDTNGHLIGIASHNNTIAGQEHFSNNGRIVTRNAKINYALPVDESLRIARVLASGKSITHTNFGIQFTIKQLYRTEEKGIVITSVVPNSNAENIGLKAGDKILSINNIEIYKSSQVPYILENLLPGDPVKIIYQSADGSIKQGSTTMK